MFTRIVYLTLKTNAAPEFAKVLEQDVVPKLRAELGFQDELLFISAGGPDVVSISIWDSREGAENHARSAYPQVLGFSSASSKERPASRPASSAIPPCTARGLPNS